MKRKTISAMPPWVTVAPVPRRPRKRTKAVAVPLSRRGLSVELKVADIAPTAYAVNTTGSITLLAVPQVGADFNARVGRKIMIKSVYLRGLIQTDFSSRAPVAAEQDVGQQGRLMIIADMQPNGAAPGITDILNTATPSSHLNLSNRDRFRVLKDKVFSFGCSAIPAVTLTAYSVAPQVATIKIYKKLNLECVFNGTNGGTIADITSGALFMVLIGSVVAGTTDITANIGTRVRYTDV